MQQVLSLKWTPKQTDFLLYYANTYLKPELFTLDSKLFEEFNSKQKEFREKGRELFGEKGMSIIFGNIDNVILAKNLTIEGKEAVTIQPMQATCTCSIGDSYCGAYRCRPFQCSQKVGCGTFWLYWCNGMCPWSF